MSHWVETATPIKFFIICWHYFYRFLDLKPVALVKFLRESPLSWLPTKYWWIWEFYNFQPIFCCCLSACFADSHGNVISDVWYCSNYWHPVISIVYSNWLIMILVWFVSMWLKLIGWLSCHWLLLSVWCVVICLLTQRGTEAEGRVGGRQQGSWAVLGVHSADEDHVPCVSSHPRRPQWIQPPVRRDGFLCQLIVVALLNCWQHKGSLIRCLKSLVVDEERMGRPRSIKAASYVASRVRWWMKRGWGGLAA